MRAQLRPALVSLGLFTLLTGLLYPLVVTGIAQVVFPWRDSQFVATPRCSQIWPSSIPPWSTRSIQRH